jgi:hypothetical protein
METWREKQRRIAAEPLDEACDRVNEVAWDDYKVRSVQEAPGRPWYVRAAMQTWAWQILIILWWKGRT